MLREEEFPKLIASAFPNYDASVREEESEMFKILNVYLLTVSIIFLSCAASIQNLSKLQYTKSGFTRQTLNSGGLALLPVVAGEGMEGYRRPSGDSLANAVKNICPEIPFSNAITSLDKINEAGLSDPYADLITTYSKTAIINKQIVKQLSKAIGRRYLLHARLERFHEATTTTYSFWTGIQTLKKGEVGIFGQIWDGEDGDVVWEAQGIASSEAGELEYLKGFEQHLQVACRGLIRKLP
jgi:hypothetical protein